MSYYDDLRAGDEEMIREWGRPVKLRGKTDPIIAISTSLTRALTFLTLVLLPVQ